MSQNSQRNPSGSRSAEATGNNEGRETGIGEVRSTDLGSRLPVRVKRNVYEPPASQQQKPRRPELSTISSRQGPVSGGSIENRRPAPIPGLPSNPRNGDGRGSVPQRPPRPNYVPSILNPSEVQEQEQRPAFGYQPDQQPIRPQPRYSSTEDDDQGYPTYRPSMSSSRSIFIGFDPTNSPDSTPTSANSLGVIPPFPSVPPPIPSGSNQNKRSSNGPPPARRAVSSYYSTNTMVVSPIPEESLGSERHGSYASSAVIPSSWGTGAAEYFPSGDDAFESDNDDNENSRSPTSMEDRDEEQGLVRQASLGRKSRPIMTEIRAPDRVKSPEQMLRLKNLRAGSIASSRSNSLESIKVTAKSTGSGSLGRNSPAKKSSPTLQLPTAGSTTTSFPGLVIGQSPASSRSTHSSPLAQPPMAFKREEFKSSSDSLPFSLEDLRKPSAQGLPPGLAKELGISPDNSPTEDTHPAIRFPAAGGLMGRRRPLRLDMDAVRDAEARGSLTSLPDLIRRATKLAAVLETGRPDSRWGVRASYMNTSSSRSGGRDTDSISDILASFPPPVLAQPQNGRNRGSRPLSQWPLPEDYAGENDTSLRDSNKRGRRICGLPLWAFVLLVILALLVISAAVIVPLQLVNLSKSNKDNDDSQATLVANCRAKTPCQNGGENIVTRDFCGCVCTSGFTGISCTQKADLSCATMDLEDLGRFQGIQNVTLGNALPRLFNKANPSYNIKLDPAMILAKFSAADISCTAQNSLVQFNGKTAPDSDSDSTKRRWLVNILEKRQIISSETSTASVPAPTASSSDANNTSITASRLIPVDEDAVDFARVAVLFLAQAKSLNVAETAQGRLQNTFTRGVDFGNLDVGNDVTVEFDSRSIVMPGNDVVGGVNGTKTATGTPTTTSSGGSKPTGGGEKRRREMKAMFGELLG